MTFTKVISVAQTVLLSDRFSIMSNSVSFKSDENLQYLILPSTRVSTMQEERLAAEEAAHVAAEEAIRKAEVQAAQKAKEAGHGQANSRQILTVKPASNISVWSICDSMVMSGCSYRIGIRF